MVCIATKGSEWTRRLEYPKGVLEVLKGTRLFGSMVDEALEDIEYLMNELRQAAKQDGRG